MAQLARAGELKAFTPHLALSGDELRNYVAAGGCPLGCNEGWLPSLRSLAGLVRGYTSPATLEHHPICPVCIGLDIMQAHQNVRVDIDRREHVNQEYLGEIYARMNQRRRLVRYGQHPNDESQWSRQFLDLMDVIVVDDNVDDENRSQFEEWDEAMEPSNDAKLRPASEVTIATLPRRKYKDIKKDAVDTECLICLETFQDGQVVVVLACGHCFCKDGCIEPWLRNYNTCPKCRARVPAARRGGAQRGTEGAGGNGASDLAVEAAHSAASDAQDVATRATDAADALGTNLHGEDVEMIDA